MDEGAKGAAASNTQRATVTATAGDASNGARWSATDACAFGLLASFFFFFFPFFLTE